METLDTVELTPEQKIEAVQEFIDYLKANNPYEKELIADMEYFKEAFKESLALP